VILECNKGAEAGSHIVLPGALSVPYSNSDVEKRGANTSEKSTRPIFLLKEIEIIQTANSWGDFWKDSAFNFLTTAPLLIPGGFAWKGETEGLKLGIRLTWWVKALVRGTAGGRASFVGSVQIVLDLIGRLAWGRGRLRDAKAPGSQEQGTGHRDRRGRRSQFHFGVVHGAIPTGSRRS
jgi:hypothetical protein